MIHAPKTSTSYLISFLISALVLTSGSLCAQENALEIKKGEELPSAPPRSDAKDDAYQTCMENFDIDTLNLKDPQIIPYLPLLVDYYQCKAVAKDNVGICNQLYWADRIAACTQAFEEYHGFYGRLLLKRNPQDSQIISTCMKSKQWPREQCIAFGEAWLKNDVSICDKVPDAKSRAGCKAAITGDSAFCSNQQGCLEKATYIKAIKSGNPQKCKNLKYSHFTVMCEYDTGTVTDEKKCEKNNKFRQFQKKVCETKTSVKESTK